MKSTSGRTTIIIVLLAFVIASILIFGMARAQDETSNRTVNGTFNILEDVTDNETVDNETFSEGFVLGNSTDTLNETVENVTSNVCKPNLTENITLNRTNITNETSNETSNKTVGLNETNETINETSNETSQGTIDLNETHQEPVVSGPIFYVDLNYSEKITRGENLIVRATVLNRGSSAKNVVIKWILPDGFETDLRKQRKYCGKMGNGDSCYSEIDIGTSLSTDLGLDEIKVVVNYEA